MKLKPVLLSVWITSLIACNSEGTNKETSPQKVPVNIIQEPRKVSDVEPNLRKADSLQVIYYDQPEGDSLRHTRYFTYTETNDTGKISILLRELDKVYVQQNTVRKCRSEGKFYLLTGEEILKTVYFSTRGDSCSYFYFIKDGNFLYIPLSAEADKLLKENKKKARKPKANA